MPIREGTIDREVHNVNGEVNDELNEGASLLTLEGIK